MKTIYLDMDGVIVDMVGGVMRLFGQRPLLASQVTSWDGIPAVLGKALGRTVEPQEMWARIAERGAQFWDELEWTPWGPAIYELCTSIAPVVIMSAPTGDHGCADGKLNWIRRNLHAKQHNYYAFTPCKHLFAHPGAILVDDGQHNFTKFRKAGGAACLFPAPWNDWAVWPTTADALKIVRKAIANAED